MTAHSLILPVSSNTPQVTSGSRGAPELDFDFINAVESQVQSRVGNLTGQVQSNQMSLSTLLNNVNLDLKESRKKKRDSDLIFRTQANELATESDRITQNAMEAAADPFNELKALFTDTPSMAEWGARQNAVQNQLNKAKRGYATTQAEYNFDLQEIAAEMQFGRQKLAMTRENLAILQQTAGVITTQVNARSALFNQQLSTFGTIPELQAEFDDPDGQIPKGLVRMRIQELQLLDTQLASARSSKGKSQLEIKKLEFNVFKDNISLIDTNTMRSALSTGKPQRDRNTTILITPQMAKVGLVLQNEKQQERAKLIVEMTENAIEGQRAFTQSVDVLQRAAGPGISVIGRGEQGGAVGFNMDAISPDMQRIVTSIADLRGQAQSIDRALASPDGVNEEIRTQQQVVRNEINRRASDLNIELIKLAKANATKGMKDEQAIEATEQWIESGFIRNETGANTLLMENAASSLPGLDTSATHGIGWGKGMAMYSQAFVTEWDSLIANDPDIFGEDQEIDSKALLASLMAGNVNSKEAGKIASSRALRSVNGKKQNEVASAILNDMYEVALNYGVRTMMLAHDGEENTVKALDALVLGDVALSPAVMQATSPDGTELDGVNVLIGRLALIEQELKKSQALPEDASLVHEFRSLMLNSELYSRPEFRALTKPTTEAGAGLNRMIFNNNAASQFRNGMMQVIRSVPVDDLSSAIELVNLQSKVGLVQGTPEEIKQQLADRQRLQELKDAGAGRSSLGPTIRHLMLSEEE